MPFKRIPGIYGLSIHNNPEKIFVQIWDENNNSNNRKSGHFNPFSNVEAFNFKAIRLFDYEFTFADIFLLLFIILLVFFIYNNKFFINFIRRQKGMKAK